jgi:fatty-acyl-CoA synthase
VAVASPSADQTLDELLAEERPSVADLPVGLDDLCFLIYTSGTTGDPKGVMLTHGNVTWNALNYLSVTDFRASDVTLAIAPLFRAGGWGVTLLPTLQKGGTVVLLSAFDPEQALTLIARHGVTTMFGGPELLTA